jgi:polysaccharide biosynthesis protein PslH
MKRVLFVAPFGGIYPPMNGGLVRCSNLMNQLAKHFQLTVLALQEKGSLLKAADEFSYIKNSSIFSTSGYKQKKDLFSLLPARLSTALRYRYWNRSLKGPANANFLELYPVLVEILKKESFDYVILEDMSILNLAKVVKRIRPKSTVIYDAYNVNTILAKASLSAGLMSRREYELVEWTECNLTKFVNHVFTCSENDLSILSQMNNGRLKGMVVPNGVGVYPLPASMAVQEDKPVNVLFCGSLEYAPNVEGLSWFYKQVWPLIREKLPQAKLNIVGSGTPDAQLLPLKEDNSISFVGRVPSVAPYYQQAAVSIVPLLSGSGTRLKVLEAMSKGTPIVSTTIGSEGINYKAGSDMMVADDPVLFAQHVAELMQQKEKRLMLQQNARQLVIEQYDWNKIGKDLESELPKL